MVSFNSKKLITPTGVSDTLRRTRQAEHLSITAAAKLLGISPKYLEAIERGNYKALPGDMYARKFIKKYGDNLRLNGNDLVNRYLEETGLTKKTEEKRLPPRAKTSRLWDGPKLLRRGLTLALLAGLLYYLGAEVGGIFAPPPLTVESPTDGMVVSDNKIEIKGVTLPESKVQINGAERVSDNQGKFAETLTLTPGLNKILITAVKKHSRPASILRNVIFEEKTGKIEY